MGPLPVVGVALGAAVQAPDECAEGQADEAEDSQQGNLHGWLQVGLGGQVAAAPWGLAATQVAAPDLPRLGGLPWRWPA